MNTKRQSFSGGPLALALFMLFNCMAFGQSSVNVQVLRGGSAIISSMPPIDTGIGNPEVDPATVGDDDSGTPLISGKGTARTIAIAVGTGPSVSGSAKAKSNPELVSFDGLSFRDQRLANGGNQFSVEPPDQGLCAGNGYVLESVNDV